MMSGVDVIRADFERSYGQTFSTKKGHKPKAHRGFSTAAVCSGDDQALGHRDSVWVVFCGRGGPRGRRGQQKTREFLKDIFFVISSFSSSVSLLENLWI
jgi:hypothetical protein